VLTDVNEHHITSIHYDFEPSVICFGVGAGQEEGTLLAFEQLLDKTKAPMVIDADGLNLLANNKALLEKLPAQSVLTPHPGELERLIGPWRNDFEKLEKAEAFVREYNLILVIKGAY